jgi:hypothetical protein
MTIEFTLPAGVITRAGRSTRLGAKIRVTPNEVVDKMRDADRALNGDSNDEEHDTLALLRDWLSEILEDPDRRITP